MFVDNGIKETCPDNLKIRIIEVRIIEFRIIEIWLYLLPFSSVRQNCANYFFALVFFPCISINHVSDGPLYRLLSVWSTLHNDTFLERPYMRCWGIHCSRGHCTNVRFKHYNKTKRKIFRSSLRVELPFASLNHLVSVFNLLFLPLVYLLQFVNQCQYLSGSPPTPP